MNTQSPENLIKAHQYLYYVKGDTVISDFEYDQLCKKHNFFGGGGSDRAQDYSKEIQELAMEIYQYGPPGILGAIKNAQAKSSGFISNQNT